MGSGGGTGLQETFAASGLPVMLLRRNVDEAAWKREQVSELKGGGEVTETFRKAQNLYGVCNPPHRHSDH